MTLRYIENKSILCPRDHTDYTISISIANQDGESFAVCTGCDHNDNSTICKRCIKDHSFPMYKPSSGGQFHDWPEVP